MKKEYYIVARLYGWHLRTGDGLTHGDTRTPKVGERIQARTSSGRDTARPRICGPGLHAFPALASYNAYAHYGRRISFVLLENVTCRKGSNKVSAQYRTILWQGTIPTVVRGYLGVARWLESTGFKRASMTAKARRLRAQRAK